MRNCQPQALGLATADHAVTWSMPIVISSSIIAPNSTRYIAKKPVTAASTWIGTVWPVVGLTTSASTWCS